MNKADVLAALVAGEDESPVLGDWYNLPTERRASRWRALCARHWLSLRLG